ncbi:tetratricopeptide repeat protein [Treponema pedis]|uniref:Lipoprotein n=2 Tax=Treponema pedis TaxID=409322 RepID=S6A5B2_9SPIR|nr:tetratricopeptide repeat protein [Treponema pedis]AGT45216.1 lipoprotein [Treponema pedis str. T A4]QOW60462.1 tetratricopeptide repeat protein [Treponema pedis]QSI05802.1 tetratricopeptide repeat protein [Treponema pedis]
MAKKIRFILYIICCFLILACTKQAKAKLDSLAGYMAWKQNDWISASSSFLNSLALAEQLNDEEIKIYSNFGIGSVYLMQNEDLSAFKRFENIKNAKDNRLNSSLYYQRGIIAFKLRQYDKAADCFRQSLEFDSDNVDAKINYELSKKYSEKSESKTQSGGTKGAAEKEDGVFDKAVMDLIRKKEKDEWQKITQEEKKAAAYDF